MNAEMRNRLDSVERNLGAGNQVITVILWPGETEADGEEKLDRWRNGESVTDVNAVPSTSNELVVYVMRFTSAFRH